MPLLAANTIFASSPAVRSSIVLGWAFAARRFASSWLTRLWRELAVLKRTGRHSETVFFFYGYSCTKFGSAPWFSHTRLQSVPDTAAMEVLS